ncbi:FtsX-like permease family protein [Streptomyces sp. RPA4-5]|uniref:FtsX-like permease family protein n=1 Tax=Streptomyces sp. RPA4-5 TaxID=2721245 RepID=UPI0024952B98|nr:FtsX-like permease family protein [Streptomyces sp. RPA4-5]
MPGTVVLARRETGEPRLDRLPVLGVTPQRLTRTLDPGVREGTVRQLRPGTVAVGADRARSLDLRPGATVTLRFGDGAPARLRVVAVYERSLALGDFLFSRDELLRHGSRPDGARVLVTVAPGGDRTAVAAALAAAVPGARVETTPAPVRVAAEHQALVEVVTMAAVSVIGGFTVIAVLSTLSLIAVGRRPELRLLRLAGAGRRTLRRMLRLEAAALALTGLAVGAAVAMVPLLAFSLGVARTVPHLPPVPAVVIVAVVAATTGAGTLLPARAVLRGRYPGSGAAGG